MGMNRGRYESGNRFPISANWLVGAVLLGYFLAALELVGREEATLIETFGESYRRYMQRTGRLLPRW